MYKSLDPGKIRDFCFVADMNSMIPRGWVRYWDTDGKSLSEFAGLSMGSSVSINISGEEEDEGTEVVFPEMMVLDVKLDDAADTSTFSGDVTVDFIHPWFFLNDPEPHAYEAMNNADLVKKVLRDQARGRDWPVDDEKFSKTDDNGSYSRYKSAETDLEFLVNKVLPYCAVGQLPAHLYCDERGDFWLKSFKDLYKENPKLILGPKPEDFGLKNVSDQIEKSLKDNGIDEKEVYSIDKAGVLIGGEDIAREIYPSFLAENTNSGGTATAKKRAGNMLKTNQDGKSFGAYFPVSNLMMSQTTGTTVKMVQNRSLVDSFMLMFAGSSKIDHTFRLKVSTSFIADKIRIGDTVDVILPKVAYSEEGEMKAPGMYTHWLTGKWLVTKTEHTMKAGHQAKFITNLYLSRPTFVGKESDTGLVNIPMLMGAM